MKEWLSDSKNRPIIFGISGVVILGVIVLALFQFHVFGGSSASPASTTAASTTPPPTMPGMPTQPGLTPPGVTGAPGNAMPMPGSAMVAGTARPRIMRGKNVQGAQLPPGAPNSANGQMVKMASAGKQDPYLPTYSVTKLRPPLPDAKIFAPTGQLATILPAMPGAGKSTSTTPIQAPSDVQLGHVSGIVFYNGVHAIYEANGQATIVQAGDELPDNQGRVSSIGPGSIMVKISGDRTVEIPITAGTLGDNGQGNGQGNGTNLPMIPGGPMIPPPTLNNGDDNGA